jgi:predicted tellurium resistance membrane protein TerC
MSPLHDLLNLQVLLTPEGLAGLLALTFLEVVLGVDNIVFVAVAAGRLPEERRHLGRQLGLWLALLFRVALLVGLVGLTRIDVTLGELFGRVLTIKDAVLGAGGLFLLYKGASEIHEAMEGEAPGHEAAPARPASLLAVVLEIGVINIVFSLDSVITAIGMANQLAVMVAAVSLATLLMMVAAAPVAKFIERHASAKMLALAFILLIGVALVGEATGLNLPRGYIYFAMGFALFVEVLNTVRRGRR